MALYAYINYDNSYSSIHLCFHLFKMASRMDAGILSDLRNWLNKFGYFNSISKQYFN